MTIWRKTENNIVKPLYKDGGLLLKTTDKCCCARPLEECLEANIQMQLRCDTQLYAPTAYYANYNLYSEFKNHTLSAPYDIYNPITITWETRCGVGSMTGLGSNMHAYYTHSASRNAFTGYFKESGDLIVTDSIESRTTTGYVSSYVYDIYVYVNKYTRVIGTCTQQPSFVFDFAPKDRRGRDIEGDTTEPCGFYSILGSDVPEVMNFTFQIIRR